MGEGKWTVSLSERGGWRYILGGCGWMEVSRGRWGRVKLSEGGHLFKYKPFKKNFPTIQKPVDFFSQQKGSFYAVRPFDSNGLKPLLRAFQCDGKGFRS